MGQISMRFIYTEDDDEVPAGGSVRELLVETNRLGTKIEVTEHGETCEITIPTDVWDKITGASS